MNAWQVEQVIAEIRSDVDKVRRERLGPLPVTLVASWVDRLTAALQPPPVPDQGWRDIETAPKDETRVLLFNPDAEGIWRIKTGGFYEALGGWCYDGDGRRYCNRHPPTHWMPLHDPPVETD